MTGDWPGEFEKLLRSYLPLLRDEEPLTDAVALADLGLDSMSTVGLLVDLEESFDVQFPDEALVPETFSTTAELWSVLSRLRDEASS
jgi:acyl carrier protein